MYLHSWRGARNRCQVQVVCASAEDSLMDMQPDARSMREALHVASTHTSIAHVLLSSPLTCEDAVPIDSQRRRPKRPSACSVHEALLDRVQCAVRVNVATRQSKTFKLKASLITRMSGAEPEEELPDVTGREGLWGPRDPGTQQQNWDCLMFGARKSTFSSERQ